MKKFENPELEIVELKITDVITDSGFFDEGEGREDELPIG